MTDAFMGEIRAFPYTFIPYGWAECNGQLLTIQPAYQALFAIIGNRFGGDGSKTFALPDLRGRVPIGAGSKVGLSPYSVGHKYGDETVQLTSQTAFPAHSHTVHTLALNPKTLGADLKATPTANVSYPGRHGDLTTPATPVSYTAYNPAPPTYTPPAPPPYVAPTAPVHMASATLGLSAPQGNIVPHENRQPFLVFRFCICTLGIFPARS